MRFILAFFGDVKVPAGGAKIRKQIVYPIWLMNLDNQVIHEVDPIVAIREDLPLASLDVALKQVNSVKAAALQEAGDAEALHRLMLRVDRVDFVKRPGAPGTIEPRNTIFCGGKRLENLKPVLVHQ